MSRPRCFICFKQLMYIKGKPVFATYKDQDGIERKVHRECLKEAKRERDQDRREQFNYWQRKRHIL